MRVEIWSDIACPWCFVGKHRFNAGVEAFKAEHPEVEFEVSSHSFELAPDTPVDFSGNEIEFLVKHKGMPAEQVEQMLGQMSQLGASEGLELNFNDVQHVNTRRAHRILHLAFDRGVQPEVQERLFKGYFGEGEDLSNVDTLVRLGVEAGLDADEVRAALDSDEFGARVDADITRAKMLGVSGVPFFLLEGKYGISGAQSPEAFAGAFAQVQQLEAEAASGE